MLTTQEKIIKAAKELFEQKGFAATTTKEISELAGVSEVTLFRHFETKRNLFERTVHSCIHPHKLRDYLENEVTYELEHDLKKIAYNMMETYRQNLPMFRMLFKDKMRDSMPEIHAKKNENVLEKLLFDYFLTMKKLGKMSAPPEMALKFYITNITGFLFKEALTSQAVDHDEKYFEWMLQKTIAALCS